MQRVEAGGWAPYTSHLRASVGRGWRGSHVAHGRLGVLAQPTAKCLKLPSVCGDLTAQEIISARVCARGVCGKSKQNIALCTQEHRVRPNRACTRAQPRCRGVVRDHTLSVRKEALCRTGERDRERESRGRGEGWGPDRTHSNCAQVEECVYMCEIIHLCKTKSPSCSHCRVSCCTAAPQDV